MYTSGTYHVVQDSEITYYLMGCLCMGLDLDSIGTVESVLYIIGVLNIEKCLLTLYRSTIGNSLKKQKSLYKVLSPSIKPHIYGLMGAHDAYYMRHWLVKS